MTGTSRTIRLRRWAPELGGWLFAAAVSIAIVARAATVSAELLFVDGDSLIVPLVIRSLTLGQPQDWAMSPVLFLPEIAAYAVLSVVGAGGRATLILAGIANLLALYGALRVVAGSAGPGRAPVTGAVAGFAVMGLLVFLEGTAHRDGAQFASLFTTTTYYALTLVALVVVVGLIRRTLDRAAQAPLAVASVGVVAAVSTLSNPLFAVWAAVSAGTALVVAGVRVPAVRARVALLLAALGVGAGAGYAARGFFADTIVAQGGNYLRFGQVERSAGAYARALADAVADAPGVAALVVGLGLWVLAGVTAARAWRSGTTGVFAVAVAAVAGPPLLTLGAIAVGTDAPRYVQPWLFLPLAALVCVPTLWPPRRRVRRAAGLVAGGIAAVALVLGTPSLVAAASAGDRDLACVVDWVDESGRTGAGQFWSVRAPKAHIADPARLVQVDHTLRVYTWLTNRADADGAEVTFLVTDAQSPEFVLPAGVTPGDAEVIGCGRYTILDFGDRVLPLGPARD